MFVPRCGLLAISAVVLGMAQTGTPALTIVTPPQLLPAAAGLTILGFPRRNRRQSSLRLVFSTVAIEQSAHGHDTVGARQPRWRAERRRDVPLHLNGH